MTYISNTQIFWTQLAYNIQQRTIKKGYEHEIDVNITLYKNKDG